MFDTLKQDNRLPFGLIGLMAILLVVYLYGLVSDFMNTKVPVLSTSRAVIKPIAQVSQWHLFGTYDDSMQSLPQTQLALTLQGTMVSPRQPQQSFAIIAAAHVPTKAYKIGDAIPGDATLERINKNQIVLRYQGQLQTLKLPLDQLVFPSAAL